MWLTSGKWGACWGSGSPREHCVVLQDCLVDGKLFPDEISLVGIKYDGRPLEIFCRRVFTNLYFIIIPCKIKVPKQNLKSYSKNMLS